MEKINEFPILQVIGHKNSGKTTLLQKLLKQLSADNYVFGVLKHHGHGGTPTQIDIGTDTWKYRHSGAMVTAVEGAGTFQFIAESSPKLSMGKMISYFKALPLDGLLIEGFKQADYPKVCMYKDKNDLELLSRAKNVNVIISWGTHHEDIKEVRPQTPLFTINEEDKYIPYIIDKQIWRN